MPKPARGTETASASESEGDGVEAKESTNANRNKGEFTILTAKARSDYEQGCKIAKWAKLRICKKQAKQRWGCRLRDQDQCQERRSKGMTARSIPTAGATHGPKYTGLTRHGFAT